MAPLRTSQARTARPRRSDLKLPDLLDGVHGNGVEEEDSDDEPPQKRVRTSRKTLTRSKWIPGGRGGGGRRIEIEMSESAPSTPVETEVPYTAPRSRRRRDTTRRTTSSRTSGRTRNRGTTRPRYSTAAAATAAAAHGDGYKPREERGWEEFHPDLDLDSNFAVIKSEEVDGIVKPVASSEVPQNKADMEGETIVTHTPKRKPGRPQRSRDSMLQALLTPEQPKFIPRPGPNPRERLTLPKPSYRILDPFLSYEHKDQAAVNFVNQAMANVGYQESELYIRPERTFIRQTEGSAEEDLDLSPELVVAGGNSAIGSTGVGRVEYDMDEQDVKWLEAFNKTRTDDGVAAIKPAIFEITMTKVEKEWHALEKRIPKPHPKAPQTQRPRSSSAAAVNGEPGNGEEPDSKCAICDDGDCENANAIVFCDGCDLAVHQECYGVPYIPEGQWLCRKCQLVGNARPSCIFCPNEGGAFKQTNNSKWAHLLCAQWIPEVTIGNPSLMEPITDVEKVPPSRWKLHCYICKQEMGACIQCSDSRCYEAFHLSCARQAGLYLRMKIGGGQNTLMDKSNLRAYCHRHTPADWRSEHHTDKAFERAVKHFKHHFQGQIWADSRASALAITEPLMTPHTGNTLKMTLTNKKGQKPKTIWKLPSGAPVIPEVILKSIEESLVRFSVAKKKEYVSEICKYWTLKREARRGAALLKRLQLQMDTFSSFEVTRRDYRAQGAAGRARLERRIDFAENLAKDLERIRSICDRIKEREAAKLQDALLLKDVVDTIYFPISPLLSSVLDRAMKLDPKKVYRDGLSILRDRVNSRYYSSVTTFSRDFARLFIEDLGFDAAKQENLQALYTRPALTGDAEQRDRRTLARRIVKAAQPLLEGALLKEADLRGRPYAQQMKEMDEMLFSRRQSLGDGLDTTTTVTPDQMDDVEMTDAEEAKAEAFVDALLPNTVAQIDPSDALSNGINNAINEIEQTCEHLAADASKTLDASTPPASTNGITKDESSGSQEAAQMTNGVEPPTPPMSTRDHTNARPAIIVDHKEANATSLDEDEDEGGIPWYVEQFDPVGTTLYEERWMGQDVLREMSEELSEMDEDELLDMDIDVDVEVEEPNNSTIAATTNGVKKLLRVNRNGNGVNSGGNASDSTGTKKGSKKRKSSSNKWSDRSFRVRR